MRHMHTRQLMDLGFALVCIGAITIAACALDEKPTTDPVEEGISPDSENADQAIPDDTVDAVNCSIVEFCNAPGTGARCRQRACSVNDAKAECKREVAQICGPSTCPIIFIPLVGSPIDLCNPFPAR
jgi:hypothetical protein